MVQKIASLIDETLMAMNAHLHVQMTNEEKAYLDAHFELIHIKKGEHLMNRGDEVCYLYYLEAGTIRLSFPDKEKEKFRHGLSSRKSLLIFPLTRRTAVSLQRESTGTLQSMEIAQTGSPAVIRLIHQLQQVGQASFGEIHQP